MKLFMRASVIDGTAHDFFLPLIYLCLCLATQCPRFAATPSLNAYHAMNSVTNQPDTQFCGHDRETLDSVPLQESFLSCFLTFSTAVAASLVPLPFWNSRSIVLPTS